MNPEPPLSRRRFSGKKVVPLLFAGVALLWIVLFFFADSYKRKRKGIEEEAKARAERMLAEEQGTGDPALMRSLLSPLPREWVKVTAIEGQGYVLYVPCYAEAARLAFRLEADSTPGLNCDFCDISTNAPFLRVKKLSDSGEVSLSLPDSLGRIEVLTVDDSLLARYPNAPFKDYLLEWKTPAGETQLFAPESQAQEFEVLKAEDENPEGCSPAEQP